MAGGSGLLHGEFTSLTGSWVLDKSRSDVMEPYLQCLNVAELAIEAQAKCEADSESRNVINIDGTQFAIHKRTKINALTEHFELGKEREMPARSGTRKTMVTLRKPGDYSAIDVTTAMPISTGALHLLETRTLMDKGHTCLQELHLTNLATGAKCLTRRVWVRVPTTHEDRAALEEETPPLTCMPGPMTPGTVMT
ncbi:hypothetical protein JKP88DRAFT_182663 [Tribonema minus]|uniref:Uncharacterized protein n=1 Tax=Tribonema minus TaxID=303371 RepID=A0A835ZG67_9STRA|nr:hypothetical protein JKP88DRAFT_182663 [Tribonema minus]